MKLLPSTNCIKALYVGIALTYGTNSSADFYVGAEVSLSVTKRETVIDQESSNSLPGIGGGVLIGYDYNNRMSFEMAVLSDAIYHDSDFACHSQASLSALYYFSKKYTDRIDSNNYYAKIGIQFPFELSNDSDRTYDKSATPSLALGIDRTIRRNVDIRGEMQWDKSNTARLMIGIVKRFDHPNSITIPDDSSLAHISNSDQGKLAIENKRNPLEVDVIEGININLAHGLDSDDDGVPNVTDRCANSLPGAPVKSSGCVYLDNLLGINFTVDSDGLTAETAAVLDFVSQELIDNPELNVVVEGHTDNRGSVLYNQQLSEKRASMVRNYIINNHKINPSRLTTRGLGESNPIESNETWNGRFSNRRTVFSILD